MSISNTVQYIFSEDGPMKQLKNDYIPRPSQIEGAIKIASSLLSNEHFIFEGPCGTGKTLAYLTPIFLDIMESKFTKKAVIVTNGISLQEQLVGKDIPFVKKVIELDNPGCDIKFALLKGKQNFICNKKMEDLIAEGFTVQANVKNFEEFEKAKNWYFKTKVGDLSELDFILSYETLNDIACVSEGECIGKSCDRYTECYYQRHKIKMLQANIIVTNFHMLFSDWKTGGMILPKYDILVFDEAHEAANIFREFRAIKASINVMKKIRNDFSEIFNKDSGLKNEYQDRFDAKEFIIRCEDFFENLGKETFKLKFDNIKVLDGSEELSRISEYRNELDKAFNIADEINEKMIQYIAIMRDDGAEDGDEELVKKQRICNKASSLVLKLGEIMDMTENYKKIASDDNDIFWIEKERGRDKEIISINRKPLMVGPDLFASFFNKEGLSCILTSATMSVNENFEYIKEQTGLDLIEKGRLNEFIGVSPFDLTKQQLWYLPENAIDGNSKEFNDMLPRRIDQVIRACKGGVLCLFTSIKNLNNCYDNLKWEFPSLSLLKQGDKPRTQLIEDFKRDKNSVLFATKSFFTGIDVPGDALRCVIIDKFPFPTPSDPVQQKLKSRPNAFYKYSIPDMIISLKQAVGRGVRGIDDKCVISIMDGRMSSARYKARIFNSFNYEKTGCRNIDDVINFFGNKEPIPENPYIDGEKGKYDPNGNWTDEDSPF